MGAETGTIFFAQRLDRHRGGHGLGEQIVQVDHRPSKPARLEVVPQTDPVLRNRALSFGIDRLLGSRIPP